MSDEVHIVVDKNGRIIDYRRNKGPWPAGGEYLRPDWKHIIIQIDSDKVPERIVSLGKASREEFNTTMGMIASERIYRKAEIQTRTASLKEIQSG